MRETEEKHITTVKKVWKTDLNYHKIWQTLALNFELQELLLVWEGISHSQESFILNPIHLEGG